MSLSKSVAQLKLVALVMAGVGGLMALAAIPSLSAIGALLVDLAFWPFDGRPSIGSPEARLLIGIGGGVVVGLSALVWMVADRVMPRDPEAARAIVATGLGSWFVVDSLASAAAGAPFNALLNVPILLAFLWPLRGIKIQPA